MRAFIIRPFGVKSGIDFERVERELIAPALDDLKVSGRTTGEILEAGNIRTDMFQQLLVADLVVADISTNNANAFYELGIRHALRDRHTFLLRSRSKEPPAEAAPNSGQPAPPTKKIDPEEVPFDLRTDRYLAYNPDAPGDTLPQLIAGLRDTLAQERKDSPVFLSLPGLKAPGLSQFTPVPQDFADEVIRAVENKQRSRLALLALEVMGLTWEREGLRTIGRVQFKAKYTKEARNTWEAVRKLDQNDTEANLLLGTIYQQLNNIPDSNLCVNRVLNSGRATTADLAEAYALKARNQKQLWMQDWQDASAEDRPLQAFSSPFLLDTYKSYSRAFEQDLNAFYPGINALAMLRVFSELAKLFPDSWKSRFVEEAEWELAAKQLERDLQSISAAVDYCIRANQQRLGDSDQWLNVTYADFLLLMSTRPGAVEYAYRTAATHLDPMSKDSVRRQLDLYSALGLFKDNTSAAYKGLGDAHGKPPAQKRDPWERVVVFTGHRVDDPGSVEPRFPAGCEARVRVEIKKAITKLKQITSGQMLGIAGAASGGDILFHEICRELDIPTKICLALPKDKYAAASVQPSDGDWLQRFYKLIAQTPDVMILSDTATLQGWISMKKDYSIWQRNNLWELCQAMVEEAEQFSLIALWDGKEGKGPGGTEHMVRIANEQEAQVEILDIKKICV